MPCSHLKGRFHINIEKHQEKSRVKVKYTFTTLSKKERKKNKQEKVPMRKPLQQGFPFDPVPRCTRYLCHPNLPKPGGINVLNNP